MQAHVRHVERLTNFMSPVGLSLSHYGNGSHPRKRQRFSNLTNSTAAASHSGPNSAVHSSGSDNSDSNPNPSHKTHSQSKPPPPPPATHTHSHKSITSKNNNDDIKQTENQWTREHLSLKHHRNRAMYHDNSGTSSPTNKSVMNAIIDKLLVYGYETSADIAKMQPWQLRVLKKEIPQIDYIFMTAYRMWGKQEYYDDHQNMSFRQFFDPAVWLQYNEIELIIKCFDAPKRGYVCMICGTNHGLYELDQLRWHIWLDHKNSAQLNAEMQASKKHFKDNFITPMQNLNLPSLDRPQTRGISPNIQEKTKPQVISLIDDSSDDDIDVVPKKKIKHSNSPNHHNNKKFQSKGRQYRSRRRHNTSTSAIDSGTTTSTANSHHRRSHRRSSRLHKNNNNNNTNDDVVYQPSVQNPIIINGYDENEDDEYDHNENTNVVRSSQPPQFMPSAQSMSAQPHQNRHNKDNATATILETMDTMKNDSNFSIDSRTTMDMDEQLNGTWNTNAEHNNNNNLSPQPMNNMNMTMNIDDDDSFNPIGIGFNSDSFDNFDAMDLMNRQSSDSFNKRPNLNSTFMGDISVADPTYMQQFNANHSSLEQMDSNLI